jgi:hypothetical protein
MRDAEITNDQNDQEMPKRPWIVLQTTYDVEAWIDNYNRELQRSLVKPNAAGYGICFYLTEGGEIFLHTTAEGDVLLDITPEAEWVTPVIIAVTQVEAPLARIWTLPGHTLTQLVLGLSSLIEATSIVLSHDFKLRKK